MIGSERKASATRKKISWRARKLQTHAHKRNFLSIAYAYSYSFKPKVRVFFEPPGIVSACMCIYTCIHACMYVCCVVWSHFDGIRSVVFHPTDAALITAGEDHVIKLWSLQKSPAKKYTPFCVLYIYPDVW